MKWQQSFKPASLQVAIVIGLVLTMTVSMAAEERMLSISQVRTDRQQFTPQQQQALIVSFQLNRPAAVNLRWFDGRDLMVREIQSPRPLPAGTHQLSWDGKDQTGRWVPDEAYRYVLEATDEASNVVTYDPTDTRYGEEIHADQVRWDALTQRIHYRLSQPARVNIRAGLSHNGPLLRTITDWLPRPAGDQWEAWDGWDESGVLDISAHQRLEIAINTFALGDNAVIVGTPNDIQWIDDITWPEVHRAKTAQPPKRMYSHAQQALTERGDIQVKLSLPDTWPADTAGRAIVSGIVAVRLEVAAKDRQRALDRRFEPVFFIDGTFAFENEVGYLPTTWLWDTREASPGQHFINANLRGYEGNFGMASLPVNVIKEQ